MGETRVCLLLYKGNDDGMLYSLTDLSVYFPLKMLYNGKAILFLLC